MRARVGVERLDERVVPSPMGSMQGVTAAADRAAANAARAERRAARAAARAARLDALRAARAARLDALGLAARARAVVIVAPAPAVTSQVVVQPSAAVPPTGAPTGPVLVPEPPPDDVKTSPMAKAGQDLLTLYNDFTADGDFDSGTAALIRIEGSTVGVDIRVSGDIAAAVTALQALGMRVEQVDAGMGLIEGMLPIDRLPDVVALPQVVSLAPIYTPRLNAPQPVQAAPSGGLSAATPPGAPTDPTQPPLVPEPPPDDVKTSPMAKAGQDLLTLYNDFTADGDFDSSTAALIRIEGAAVGVDIRVSGDLAAAVTALQALGMRVEQVDAGMGLIEGMLPIDRLPDVAALPQVIGLAPIYRPALNR